MEYHREYKHEMHSIADTNDITKNSTIRYSEVYVKVGKYIVKGWFAEEKITEEACGYVNSGAEC